MQPGIIAVPSAIETSPFRRPLKQRKTGKARSWSSPYLSILILRQGSVHEEYVRFYIQFIEAEKVEAEVEAENFKK